MTINVRKTSDVTVLDVVGPLTAREPVQTFRHHIQEQLASGSRNLAINLAGVTDLDSSGVGNLFAAVASIKAAGGKCKLFAATERVTEVLRRTHLDAVFELLEDEASALSAFRPP